MATVNEFHARAMTSIRMRMATAKAKYPQIGKRMDSLKAATKNELWTILERYHRVMDRDRGYRKNWLVDDILRAEFRGLDLDDFWNIVAGYAKGD